MVNPKLYAHRDSAERIRQQYLTQVEEVRNNRDLSDEGRNHRLAEIYTKTKAKLDELATREANDLDVRKSRLERDLFGARGAARGLDAGALAISARDAADRATQLQSPAEAHALLRRAEADGDELLARAIARRCIEGSESSVTRQAADEWDDVTRSYLDNRPSLMPVVEELAQIEDMTKRQVFSPFSVGQPQGLTPKYIKAASGANPSAEFSEAI